MRENLKIFFNNYGFYLWPVVVAVVIINLLMSVDLPKLTEINAIRRELSSIHERLAKLSAKSSFLLSLDEKKLKVDYAKTSLVLPDGKDAPSILRTLEASASYSGVFVESLDLAPGKLATVAANESSDKIFLKVTINGKTENIVSYLEKIISVGRIIDIKKLEITFSEGTASAKANLELAAYFLNPPPSKSKVDEPLPSIEAQEKNTLAVLSKREVILQPLIFSSGKTDLFK